MLHDMSMWVQSITKLFSLIHVLIYMKLYLFFFLDKRNFNHLIGQNFLISFSLAFIKKQRFCSSPLFMLHSSVSSWKGMLEFLMLHFRPLTLFGIGLFF